VINVKFVERNIVINLEAQCNQSAQFLAHKSFTVTGAGAFLSAGYVVVDVVASAIFAAVEPVSLSHNCFWQR
jgi:hypothetical protein